jgi:hypothetical protein
MNARDVLPALAVIFAVASAAYAADVTPRNGSSMSDAAPRSGVTCRITADCAPTGSNPLICSYTESGCGAVGTCVTRRMCLDVETFCGCDGTSFTTDVCYDGIPRAWAHRERCDSALDAGD